MPQSCTIPCTLFLSFTVQFTLTCSLSAATINVAGDRPTIQAGIDAAVYGDDIEADRGIYLETIDFLGKSIIVRSVSGDPNDTIIDGTGFDTHVVTCTSGEDPNTVLAGFTITGGNANGAAGYPGQCGGGMLYDSTSPTVSNGIHWADSPDEIYYSNSTATISFSDLQGGLPSNTVDGGGNIDVDPLFVDADGPDNMAGTDDDNLRLSGGIALHRRGEPTGVSSNTDHDDNLRGVDDAAKADMGVIAFGVVVDMGAYEFQPPLERPLR